MTDEHGQPLNATEGMVLHINPVLAEYAAKRKRVAELEEQLATENDLLGGLFEQVKALPADQRKDDYHEVIVTDKVGSGKWIIDVEKLKKDMPKDYKEIIKKLKAECDEAKKNIEANLPKGRIEAFIGKEKYKKITTYLPGKTTQEYKVIDLDPKGK